MLDSSGSVGEANFELMKSFVQDILKELNVESCKYRIGVMKYGSSALIQFHLNAFSTNLDLMAAIDEISFSYGTTFTADALRSAREDMFTEGNGDRSEARNIAVLITDGLDNVHARRTLQEVRYARNAGIYIIPIGVAIKDVDKFVAMATEENGHFLVDRFYNMQYLVGNIVDKMLEGKYNQIVPSFQSQS